VCNTTIDRIGSCQYIHRVYGTGMKKTLTEVLPVTFVCYFRVSLGSEER